MIKGYHRYRGSRRHNQNRHYHGRQNRKSLVGGIARTLFLLLLCIGMAAIITGLVLGILKHRFPLLPCILIAVIFIFTLCLNRKLGYDFYTFQTLRGIALITTFLAILLCLLCLRWPVLEKFAFWPMTLE